MQCVVFVVLVRHIGFRQLIATLSCTWVIRKTKQIRSGRDIKSNQGRQYVVELELYIESIKCVKPGKRVFFFLLKISKSVILVETVQTKPYIFL